MAKYFTRDSVKYTKENFVWKKLANFQLVKPLTVEQQIERFTTAGRDMQKLAGLGVFDFDVNQPIDDLVDDVTQNDDFDMIDAAVASRDARLRLQAALAAGTDTKSQGMTSLPDSDDKQNQSESHAPRAERAETPPAVEPTK